MKFSSELFARLPRFLLLTSLALAVSALPVESGPVELKVLNPENFDSTVSNGVW